MTVGVQRIGQNVTKQLELVTILSIFYKSKLAANLRSA